MDRLTRLMIREECRQLITDYAWFADQADGAAMAGLFATDGVLIDGDGATITPADMRAGPVPGTAPRTIHVCSNITIEVLSEAEARGRTLLSFYYAMEGGSERLFAGPRHGHYVDLFRNTASGWRIFRREYQRLTPPPRSS